MDTPKVFISYSWHPKENQIRVQQLAERLSSDGFHVIIDIWDLQDGQDKNKFMEQMVANPEVKKVLLICTKEYAEKANTRKGGVGIESTIVSEEIYTNAGQTKFIPVVYEYENDKPCVPGFAKSRIFVDLSNDEKFEGGYDQLLRDIYDKPRYQRPPIGKMPSYFEAASPVMLPTSNNVKSIKSAIIKHYITHDAVNVPLLINQACFHIVFHAAYYPKYGFDQQGKDLWSAMENNPRLHLTAIFTDVDHVVWKEEFCRVLRPFYTAKEFKDDLFASKRHFVRCLSHFGPKRVRIIDTSCLPLFPVIMIDNTLIIGHYAHSREIAPDGLWFTIQHPKILSMYECLLAGSVPVCDTDEEKAILRYIEEVFYTINQMKVDSNVEKQLIYIFMGIVFLL